MGRPLSGWTKRHKKTFGTRKKKWDGNFRLPPKPRDKGMCNHCDKQCTRRGWDLDHVRPLLEQKGLKEDELNWDYYTLTNMQTLCRPCHREKTNKDIKKRK